MPERRLLIDLGNSRLKWAWATAGELDTASAGKGGLKELEQACRDFGPQPPDEILLSSVAGDDRTRQATEACAGKWAVPVRRLRSQAEQGGVRCGYADPSKLGADRWLALVGAVATYGKPVVVWDLGTATTLDAVDQSGRHLGGLILPGPETMRLGLGEKTRLDVPGHLGEVNRLRPGRDTGECIVQGIMAAQVGAARLFLDECAAVNGQLPALVVTGGAAAPVREALGRESVYDPWLVFRGMLVDRGPLTDANKRPPS